jgi:hypothetical protein
MRLLLAALLLFALPAFAQNAETEITYGKADIPKEIAAAAKCDTGPESIMGERFAGGWLWRWPCPSNHANQISAFVFSRDKEGKDAKLVRFPTPHKGKRAWLEDISNAEVFPAAREFNHFFTDPENKSICRTEAAWVSPDPLKPRLIFWREAKACEGDKGWRTLIDKRKK